MLVHRPRSPEALHLGRRFLLWCQLALLLDVKLEIRCRERQITDLVGVGGRAT